MASDYFFDKRGEAMDFLETNPWVARHLQNTVGRDFIVGDLHGRRDMLDRLLQKVDFHTATDRLFSVGDLVNRGPDSWGCLELLRESWFYPVLGNHEAMLLAWMDKDRADTQDRSKNRLHHRFLHWQRMNRSGTEWRKRSRLMDYASLLAQIPAIRIVGEDAQRFHVAHAELADVYGMHGLWDYFLDSADLPAIRDGVHYIPTINAEGSWVEHVLCSRGMMQRMKVNQDVFPPTTSSLSRTYVGHTVIPLAELPCQAMSHVYLDTGAFKASLDNPEYGLTIYNHTDQHGISLNGDGHFQEWDLSA